MDSVDLGDGGDEEDGVDRQGQVGLEALRYQVGNGGGVRGFRMVHQVLEAVVAMEAEEVGTGGNGGVVLVPE